MMQLRTEADQRSFWWRWPRPHLCSKPPACQDDLRRAGIEPWAWAINNSVAAALVASPLLRQRAHNELREIEGRYPPATRCAMPWCRC